MAQNNNVVNKQRRIKINELPEIDELEMIGILGRFSHQGDIAIGRIENKDRIRNNDETNTEHNSDERETNEMNGF